MDIKVLNVSVEDNIPTKSGKGTYSKVIVTFNNLANGKVEAKQIFPFSTSKDVFEKIKQLEANQTYSVTMEKDQGGFWIWTDVARQDGAPEMAVQRSTAGHTPPAAASRPQYETGDERAARQVFIIKQSSLANAINLLKTEKVSPSPQDVMKVAQLFTNWVMQTPSAELDIADMQDDIPL